MCHRILESHLKEGRLPLWKENGSFGASFLLFLKKKKATMLQYFSRQNTVPDGGGNTEEQKRRYLGFRGDVGKAGGGGAEPRGSWMGARGGGSLSRWRTLLPFGEVPPRTWLRGPPVPDPSPSQPLRTPQRAAHAQLFVCGWSFFLRKHKQIQKRRSEKESGRRMGWRKGKRRGKGAALFAAADGGRVGLLFC